ncbi:polyamine deacetylase HDAC10 isoform X4 [Canis lupus baileyi]|uniref:polyamine deacetylase HDAC10 isoform X5 n=1 Tax=Canis lupus dingo TaxID=286419 RepID=UPI0015F1B143|nr:polyamine deacetylase HDAC10 isoform X5 [Canis lupus dingo]XP_038406072.1 polyamine deacetylase HDAC10 isoform X4 [Canis lupus familiaris]XP_038491767.1 polyamine deacetylase HDAC10 isoform X4 [Canis lupus familiaris]XP_038535409.1 polyamine deacetylase HDAC10 isoform X4 [Canis lupus familiaris]
MRTALVYHEDMTAARLLWEDPECEIERPERLTAALRRLQQGGLEQRCLQLAPREASEAELGLVHSPEYVSLLRGTQALDTQELRALSGQYDAVYFHPSTFHCARLAVGAALQLVDAVLMGAVHNGLALVRPPGHHSQRAAANGFCVFNNVAIAARHAQQKHGLQRILIVDWDVHHGQGIQYIFEDDPSVLYFSWHRYEHGRFWPYLRESDADAVGQGKGRGFTVNLPWNQVGMGNADYLAAFLHVLLPVAFEFDPELVLVSAGFDSAIGDPEGQMQATPECFGHLTQLLQVLAGGRVCAVLEGGYHLESLSQSVCMVVRALLGDPVPPLSGPMEPHRRYGVGGWGGWVFQAGPCCSCFSLQCPGVHPERPGSPGPSLDQPPAARLHEALAQDTAFTALGKVLHLLKGILDGQVSSGVATTPAAAAMLDVALRCSLSHRAQRVLCVAVGQLDRPPDLANDGRTLWLDIRGKEAAALSPFHVSMPLPGTTGAFLSCVLALVLPLAYGFRPDLVLMVLGPAQGLQEPHAALLAALLRGPAGGRVLVLVEQEPTSQLAGILARVLHGDAPPSLGPFSTAPPEDTQALLYLRGQLEAQWKMLQVAAPS